MDYKIMRMLCMFDLPMDTPEEKRNYRQFRKALISDGFTMVQFSIYSRTCPNREFANRMENRIKRIVPKRGNVRLLCVTEKQYADMKLLVGSKSASEMAQGTERLIVV